jgi:hypothetical protein
VFPAIAFAGIGPGLPFHRAGVRDFQQALMEEICSYELLTEILAGIAMRPRALAASSGLAPWSMVAMKKTIRIHQTLILIFQLDFIGKRLCRISASPLILDWWICSRSA